MSFGILRRKIGIGLFSCPRKYCSISGTNSIKNHNIWGESRNCPRLMLSSDKAAAQYKLHSVAGGEDLILEKKKELALQDLETVGTAHGWVAMYNSNSRDDDVFLWNPMNGQHLKLPPLRTSGAGGGGGVSRVAISEDGRSAMIIAGRARRLAFCSPGRSSEWAQLGDLYCRNWNGRERIPREYEDVVYSNRHKVFYCISRVGTEFECWNVSDGSANAKIKTKTEFGEWGLPHSSEELMYGYLDRAWPCRSERFSSEFELKQKCWHLKYLVFAEERDELFLVVRHVNPRYLPQYDLLYVEPVYYSKYRGCELSHPYTTHDFDVYKIHIDNKGDGVSRLEYMEESLDGLAMFVGMSHSYAAEADLELKPNSIYFTDEKRLMRLSQSDVHNEYGGHDNGIFDYQNKTFSTCNHKDRACPLINPVNSNEDYHSIRRIDPPPLWFAPPPLC